MENTVWIIQENTRLNFNPATKYGNLKFITSLEISNIQKNSVNDKIKNDINTFLDSFNPAKDYIITNGDPNLLFLIGFKVLDRFGTANVLKWEKHSKEYQVYKINHFM